jgi:putative transposase
MPIKRPQLANGEIYHIIVRGVGDSVIFKNKDDYYRGIFSLYEFNTESPVEIRIQRQQRKSGEPFSDNRELLVEVFAFCFMPNHIHLLLRQTEKNGISDYMQKFGAGYVGYFNRKYERKGPLFGKFRAVHIKSDNQLQAVYCYIHTNPASLIDSGWKGSGTKMPNKVVKYLEKYKWSSFQDYIGKKNFPSVTERGFMIKALDGEKRCGQLVRDWVRHKKEIISDLKLE